MLLILAGVVISLEVGDNGVLKKSSGAVEINREAKAQEEVEMAWASAKSKYFEDWAQDSSKDIREYYGNLDLLNGYVLDTGRILSSEENEDKTWTVQYKANDQGINYTFTIDEAGKVRNLVSSREEPVLPIPEIANISLTFNDLISSSELKITTNIEYKDEANTPEITEYIYYIYKDEDIVTNQTTTDANWTANDLNAGDEYDIVVSVKSSGGNISSSEAVKYKKKAVWDKYNYNKTGNYTYQCVSENATRTFTRGDKMYECTSVENCFDTNTGKWTNDLRYDFGTWALEYMVGRYVIGCWNSDMGQESSTSLYYIVDYIDHDGSYGEKYHVNIYASSGTTTYSPKGNSLGKVNSENLSQYPDDGYMNGYYYKKI